MLSYLRVLVLYRIVVAAGLVLGLGTAAAVTFTTTPTYASQVTFFLSVPGSPDPTNAAEKARSYAELLTNERLSADIIESLNLDQEPSALAERITARLQADTVLITARVTDTSPSGAQRIASALSAAFVDIVAKLEQPAGAPQPGPGVTATVVQPATLSPVAVSPVPALNLTLGAILGLLAGIGGALALHAVRGQVRSLDELSEVTGAAALGGVWNDPDAHAKPLAIMSEPNGARAEGYRAIRTRLLASGITHKTVAVVSPDHADGRTATACNLAAALAHTGRRVALVDGDTRGPGVMAYLGREVRVRVEPADGDSADLSDVLTGAVPLSAAMRPAHPMGFDVLEASRSFAGLGELLSSPSMASLLDELAESYDTVIVDTAALLHRSDGPTLAAQCSTTIVIARHGQTRRKDLQAATDLLRSTSTAIIGGVLNMSPRSGARPGREAEQAQQATAPPGSTQEHPNGTVPRHAATKESAAAMLEMAQEHPNGTVARHAATHETPLPPTLGQPPPLGGTDVPRS